MYKTSSSISLSSKHTAVLRLLFCFVLAALPAGCGYGFTGDDATILGDTKATLKLAGVEQPTLYPWVGYTIRSAIRDEINSRNMASWVDSGQADYNMHLRVNAFTMRSYIKSTTDATLLYGGYVNITAIIYNGTDNTEKWRTTVAYSENFESNVEETAARLLFTQAMRRIADNMRQSF